MAISIIATARSKPPVRSSLAEAAVLRALTFCFAAAVALSSTPSAAADKVRLTNLSDVAFGTIANLGVDAVKSQDVCIYSTSSTSGYHVTGTGTGTGGTFALTAATGTLAFDVAWSSTSGQTSGSLLTPGVPLTGQVTSAKQQTCGSGPVTTASLIVILRAAALSSATAGTYNGTLTLVVGPE